MVASGFGLGSIIVSAKPADESHPYGHGKIEFFSAGFEGALIIGAAVGIFYEGVKQIMHPQDLPNLEQGLFFLIVAGLGNLVLGVVLRRVGKRTKSIVLRLMESTSSQTFSPPEPFSWVWCLYILQDVLDSTALLPVLREQISFSGEPNWCGRHMGV